MGPCRSAASPSGLQVVLVGQIQVQKDGQINRAPLRILHEDLDGAVEASQGSGAEYDIGTLAVSAQ